MNAAVVEQGRLRDRALGGSGANIAAFDRLVAYLLYRFEAMPFDAFIFVERHGEEVVPYPSYLLNVNSRRQLRHAYHPKFGTVGSGML